MCSCPPENPLHGELGAMMLWSLRSQQKLSSVTLIAWMRRIFDVKVPVPQIGAWEYHVTCLNKYIKFTLNLVYVVDTAD